MVAHPIRMGFVWGALTLALIALYEVTLGHRALDGRWLAVHVVIFAVASPAWGYLTRWAVLRRQPDARR